MIAPANHTVTVLNRFGVTITAPVAYVKPQGSGKAEVHILSIDWLDPYAYMASCKLPLNGFYRNVRIALDATR
jgi:hypothetical protein